MRTRDLRALACAALLTAALAGCSESPAGEDTRPAPEAPEGTVLAVVDGDTGAALAGARVRARGGTEEPLLTTGADGTVALPEGTLAVRGVAAGHAPGTAAVRAGSARAVLSLYDQRLQSPQYGGGPSRTRHVAAASVPPPNGPPDWTWESRTLLEFPPAVKDGLVVIGTNSGRVYALNADTGAVRWARRPPGNIAATPAIAGRYVIVASMSGTVTAYRRQDGKPEWTFRTGGSPVETSPLVVEEEVYVGDWGGRLYRLDIRTGTLRWAYRAAGEVKGSPALAGDSVIVGDYGGVVQSVSRATGTAAWRVSAGRRFYGGPGISDGVAVIGDVGGAVIGIDAASGRTLWRRQAGSFVYASPAIANGTAYIGSYSGAFEALDLRTGAVRWSFAAGGRISGSATVVGDTVYTAILARRGETRRTWGLDTAGGAVRYRGDDGLYSPAVAAGRTLYLVGGRRLSAHRAPG